MNEMRYSLDQSRLRESGILNRKESKYNINKK